MLLAPTDSWPRHRPRGWHLCSRCPALVAPRVPWAVARPCVRRWVNGDHADRAYAAQRQVALLVLFLVVWATCCRFPVVLKVPPDAFTRSGHTGG